MLQHNVRHLLVVNNENKHKPVGIVTPLDFTKYQQYTEDKGKDTIEKILEYYV
jgi:CBS domain